MKKKYVVFLVTVFAVWQSGAEVVVLQNGRNGYAGCDDTYLVMASDRAQGTKQQFVVEGYH